MKIFVPELQKEYSLAADSPVTLYAHRDNTALARKLGLIPDQYRMPVLVKDQWHIQRVVETGVHAKIVLPAGLRFKVTDIQCNWAGVGRLSLKVVASPDPRYLGRNLRLDGDLHGLEFVDPQTPPTAALASAAEAYDPEDEE